MSKVKTLNELRREKPHMIFSSKETTRVRKSLNAIESRAFDAGFKNGNDTMYIDSRQEAIRWIKRRLELNDWDDDELEEMGICDGHHEHFERAFMKLFGIEENEI